MENLSEVKDSEKTGMLTRMRESFYDSGVSSSEVLSKLHLRDIESHLVKL